MEEDASTVVVVSSKTKGCKKMLVSSKKKRWKKMLVSSKKKKDGRRC